MNRPSSPINKDYRPRPLAENERRQNNLPWFGMGLGLAILGVVLVRQLSPDSDPSEPTVTTAAAGISLMSPATNTSNSNTSTEFGEQEIDTAFPALDPEIASMVSTADFAPRYPQLDLTIESGDTLDGLFRKNELSAGDLAQIVRLEKAKDPLRRLRPGDVIQIAHEDGRVRTLTKELDPRTELRISSASEGGFTADIVEREIEIRETLRHGVIETSLFESAVTAGLNDNMIMNLAGIFAWDIDFVLDIRRGDEYYILYEELWRDGKRVDDGEIIAAEFHSNKQVYHAIRYVFKEGQSDYFAADGRSVRKAFIRAPVDFTRISSRFNPNRRHPILNTIRAHRGVDYAAPNGTPVQAAGAGKVIFRGRKTGYGNVVIVQHPHNITTLYAHLSNFDRNARSGTRVKQGQNIGFVGATGLATAPHLHYEYRVNGVHRNPTTVKLPAAAPIDSKYKDSFMRQAEVIMDRLDKYKQTQLARLN